jgi:catechol 2,3-dioxygenase-like lactoylglutathione lyase family enzyme
MKKSIIIFLALILFTFLQAQETIAFKFNHIALSVKDVNQSATFYKNVLQLQEITNRTKTDGIRWFSLGDNKELHLVSVVKEPVVINKAVHFALNTANFDAFINKLDAMKIDFSDWPGTRNRITIRADGIKQIYFQDPDGYWIEVNSVSE